MSSVNTQSSNAERILVAVAWPYANGSLHIGQVAGAYMPADIFARYHRLKGNDVLMISGSDAHGTPVTLKAEEKNIPPEQVSGHYHSEFLDNWKRLGISFDLFTSTHTENHVKVAQNIFQKLLDAGYIYTDIMSQPFCNRDRRFLADRYVRGQCPNCDFDGARGDQCDNCGRTLEPQELIDMVCSLCGTPPVIRETEHFFLKLSLFQNTLLEWAKTQNHWRPNVRNFTISYLESGLHDRAITRDIEWGVPVPLDGYENKRIYVWFEAVIGYLSASIEWASTTGDKNRWRDFWEKDCRSYYFMGKDNIPFHTIIWPAMLSGYGNLNLPFDVPANEYLQLEERKVSTSRNWAIWLPDYLALFDPDPLRYVLSATMPETGDSNFSWSEYVRRNNDELVATYGNLVHRVLTMAYRKFGGKIPKPNKLDDKDTELLNEGNRRFQEVGNRIESCKFRSGLASAMALARATNRYLEQKAPWKTSSEQAATSLWVSLSIINCLKIVLYPYLPFTSEKLHRMLGFCDTLEKSDWTWHPSMLKSGQRLSKPNPLFCKLDPDIVQKETQRIGEDPFT